MKEIETRKIFHQNGQLKAEYQINRKGERNGICKSYHENGQLRNLLSFTNGIQNPGQIITYHPNGEKSRQVILSENGNLNGLYTEWYENGEKKAEGFYRNDLCFTEKEYDEKGCLIDYKLLKFNNESLKLAVIEWINDKVVIEKKYGLISNWNTSLVTNMRNLFESANDFNEPIGNWDVSSVTDMSNMFSHAKSFNQPIGNWDVSSVTDMSICFLMLNLLINL